MKLSAIVIIQVALLIISLSLGSCKEENITNNYDKPGSSTGAPDVNIISSSYSLETINSLHIDTSSSSYDINLINLNLVLDKPENRSQINKAIIINETGYGWEFFKEDLESFYSDSLKGYKIKNLILKNNSSQSLPYSYTVKLFSAANTRADDYQLIINNNFVQINSISSTWYTKEKLQVSLNYNQTEFKILNASFVFLNSKRQVIYRRDFSESDLTSADFYAYRNLLLSGIPDEAIYYYLYFENWTDSIKSIFKGEPQRIPERYPQNVQIMENSSSSEFSSAYLIDNKNKLVLVDNNSYKLFIYDFNTMTLLNKITLKQRISTLTYSDKYKKIYYISDNSRLYSVSLDETSPVFVKNFTQQIFNIIAVNNFLIVPTGEGITSLNLETDSSYTFTAYSSAGLRYIFNEKLNILYTFTSAYAARIKFDPETGIFSQPASKGINNSEDKTPIIDTDGSKIVCSNGSVYSCSVDKNSDLTPESNFNTNFSFAAFSNDNSGLIALTKNYSNQYYSIDIFSVDSRKLIHTQDEPYVYPRFIFVKGDLIKIIFDSNIVEVYNYSELIAKHKQMFSNSEKYYNSKKLN